MGKILKKKPKICFFVLADKGGRVGQERRPAAVPDCQGGALPRPPRDQGTRPAAPEQAG